MQLYSDLFVGWVVHRTVNIFSRADSPAFYVYRFSHDGGLSFSQRLLDKKLPGVIHGDELGYLFTQDLLPSAHESELDTLVRRRMVKLWTNFARTGSVFTPLPPRETVEKNRSRLLIYNDCSLFLHSGTQTEATARF